MSTDTENANEVYKELVSKLEAAKARRESAKATAKEKAFPAHANADAKARKDLDRLNVEAATAAIEVENLEAAVAEARKRVDHAAAVAIDEQERDRARIALGLLADFEERGSSLDKAMAHVLREYDALLHDFDQLARLGYPPSTKALVEVGMRRAVQTKLQAARLPVGDFLAPHERIEFQAAISGWAQSVRGRIEARLKRNQPPKAA